MTTFQSHQTVFILGSFWKPYQKNRKRNHVLSRRGLKMKECQYQWNMICIYLVGISIKRNNIVIRNLTMSSNACDDIVDGATWAVYTFRRSYSSMQLWQRQLLVPCFPKFLPQYINCVYATRRLHLNLPLEAQTHPLKINNQANDNRLKNYERLWLL